MKISYKISKYNRSRKYNYFLKKINPSASDKILDVGFANNNYAEGINYLEKNYPYRKNITALGIGDDSNFKRLFPDVATVLYDGNIFPFSDKSFNIGWSNAVVEHVGDRERQVLFVKELLRTCDVVFFTTPNKLFPFDLHTKLPIIHWFPKKYFDKMLHLFGKSWAAGNYMRLLTKRQIVSICKEAGAASISVKRNWFLGFTMDFSIIVKGN